MIRDGMFGSLGCSSSIILLCVFPKWISFLFIHSTTLCVPVSIVLNETCLRLQTLPWRYTASLSLSTTLNKGQPRLRVNFLKNCIFCARRFPPLLLAGFSCLEAFNYKWPKGESALWGQVSGEKPRYWQGHKYYLEPGSTPCPSHPKWPLYHWASNLPTLEGPWALSIIRYDDSDITMMMIVPSVMMVIQDDHGKRAELPKSIRKYSDPIWEDLISPCGALLYLDGLKRQHLLKSRHWGRTGDLEGDHSDRSFQVLQWQFHNPKAREAEAFLAVDKENITLTTDM